MPARHATMVSLMIIFLPGEFLGPPFVCGLPADADGAADVRPGCPAALAAATVLSSLWPAWLYARAAASIPTMAPDGAMCTFHSS
ncbi:hypothetical protein ASPU41_15010 [Arthrobacter sp. U41]|nr:hypothetical protein ASPU41_15010 [Arthrobacter sp. U41]